ncbi:MAG: citramalate synthase [Spirochaetaceae bacterium]|jgi:2-isopropylmalate synthase|nr:citramalate synthase [Spirochaetaceae bacterium]
MLYKVTPPCPSYPSSIDILDTTLRDGAQSPGISFSVADKIAIACALDELGVRWIEAGNPGSNPKDREFFRIAPTLRLDYAQICAFGATRKKDCTVQTDSQLQMLLKAETETVVIFGKAWNMQVQEVLNVDPAENLAMIAETIAFLTEHGRSVIFDAEHFFDGFLSDPDYACATVQTAYKAGAHCIVLCDTNGAAFPDKVFSAVSLVQPSVPAVLGIHTHDDSGMAAANAFMAVKAGCCHVQGTLLGLGERCGNMALTTLLPTLELKLGLHSLPPGKLANLTAIARRVAEISNVILPATMPYVGTDAFSHKAGMHADAILKAHHSFEHIEPAQVGNDRHFLISEVSGRSVIAERIRKINPEITKEHPLTKALAGKLKSLEADGWQFEGADASFDLLIRRELGWDCSFFTILAYRVANEHPAGNAILCSHAWVKIMVGSTYEIAAAEGNGPVHALDSALRRALTRFYPQLERVRLSDFKVRVINGKEATAATVRVLIESTDGTRVWTTVGVSEDLVDASRAALVDSIEYLLISAGEHAIADLF